MAAMPRQTASRKPEPHPFRSNPNDASTPATCTVCGGTPSNPLHLQLHRFKPAGDDSYRDVPEYCWCGLPENHPRHRVPTLWTETPPEQAHPSLLSDADLG